MTIHSTVSLLWIVSVFLKQTLHTYSLGSLGMQWVNHAVPCINQALQQIKENSLENVRPVLEGQAKISTPRSPWLGLA